MAMVERVARVLEPQAWAALGTRDTLAYKNRRTSSLRKARAAIEAMREPTATMAEAGHAAAEYYVWEGCVYSEYTQDPSTFQPEGAPICWQAMIDAALSEQETAKP